MVRYIALALALLGAIGICAGVGGFADAQFLWILPLSFLGVFIGLAAAFFLTLWIATLFVDTDKVQEKDNRFYRFLVHTTARLVPWILRMRVQARGLEQIPKDGRFLLVCNHLSLLDPVMLLAYFRKSQLAFISKRENQTMFVIGPMMHMLLCQLINRENDREALKTILKCIQILKEDKASIAVFPEGGILSEDGKLHHFRPGVFKIAQKANVPIVVCTLKNTLNVVKNIKSLKPSHVEMNVLEVIPAEELKGVTTVDIAHRCYELMAADLGPDLIAEE